MEHPLDKIYNVSSSGSQSHPLDAVYGVANSQTPKQDWSKSLSDVGVPNIPVNSPGIIERGVKAIGKSIADPLTAIGGGIQNAIRAGGRAVGLNTPAVTSNPSLFGGNVDAVGMWRMSQDQLCVACHPF